jgi:hypothetical protein
VPRCFNRLEFAAGLSRSTLGWTQTRRAGEERTTFTALVGKLAGNHGVPMSQMITSLLKLAVVPARFGLIATDAAVSVGKSVLGLEPVSSAEPISNAEAISKPVPVSSAETSVPSDHEIDAAAAAIRASLVSGQPIDFHRELLAKFPDGTIRSIAETALLAARNARISAGTATAATQH